MLLQTQILTADTLKNEEEEKSVARLCDSALERRRGFEHMPSILVE